MKTNANQVAENTETIYLANTGAYTYKLENGEGLDNYYFKQKLHAAIKNGAKIKIRNGLTLYGWIEFSPMEMSGVEICDANRMTELGDCTDKRIAAIIEYPTNAQEEVEKIDAEIIDYLDDYAVSTDAQEVAVQAEIENAINATENALADFDEVVKGLAELRAEIAANKARGLIKFEIGKVYYGSAFVKDKYQVIKRDEDFVTVKKLGETVGGTRRMKIRFDDVENSEYVPFGFEFVRSDHEVVVSNNDTEKNHDSAEVEEVNTQAEIDCIDDYIVYYDAVKAAAEVEKINAEIKKFEVGKWYYNVLDSIKTPAYKILSRTKKMVTLTDEFGEIVKRKVRVELGIEKIYIGTTDSIDEAILESNCFCTNIEEIQKAEEDLAYSIAQDAEEIEDDSDDNTEKNLAEKVAEILNRPRKSIIDWKSTFDEMRISEILDLQKDLKKFLKLGQIELAENIFSMLKTLCRNYRAVA